MRTLVILLALMFVVPLRAAPAEMEGAEPETGEDTLVRLFYTAAERQQIDLEREAALNGIVVEEPMLLPDVFYQAVLFRKGQPPLLWINDHRGDLTQWQNNPGQLVVEELRLDGSVLQVRLQGRWFSLLPNQILMRQTGEVVEPHKYEPAVLQQLVKEGVLEPGERVPKTAAGKLLQKTKQIRKLTQLPGMEAE